MRRRYHRRARPWRQSNPVGNGHAFVIDRHRDGIHLHVPQYLPRRRVSRVFKPDAISGLQQRMRDQLDGVTISRGHEDLRRRAVDPARYSEIGRDLGAQRRQSEYGGMNHVRWLHGADAPRAEPRPYFSWKRIERRQTHLERQNRIWTKAGRHNAALGLRDRERNRRSRFEARRNDGAGLAAGLDVPFRGQ